VLLARQPRAEVSAAVLDFGDVYQGASVALDFTIRHLQTECTRDLTVTSTPPPADFTLDGSTAGLAFDLAYPGASPSTDRLVTVGFVASVAATGIVQETVTVTTDDPLSPPVTVTLTAHVLALEPLFADGFESGDTTAWTTTVP
jgi:hypothetical protein